MEREFELKVVFDHKRIGTDHWLGRDGLNAAERYEDCHRDRKVIAWRPVVHGLFVGAPGPGSD